MRLLYVQMMMKEYIKNIWKRVERYGRSKDLLCKKEEIKCNNLIKLYKNI